MRVRANWFPLGAAGALALLAGGATAQVTLDGTANPGFKGPLNGPDYEIRAELGRRAGANLFHSFGRFGLHTGESATFSGPATIRNVISRVTGGARSDIDGTLRSTIPGADLYFLNPAGVAFGPNARLDLQGSFHVSTADELRFADGATFSASSPAASSFTVAAPEAFGFLRAAPGAITIDRSTLEVPAGETFSLVGGDITIDGGNSGAASGGTQGVVRAAGGVVMLAALNGPGEASLTSGDSLPAAAADIRLIDQALVDASGNGGGTIRIQSGRFLASNQSFVFADNAGASDVRSGVALEAKAVQIESGSGMTADALGEGDAGRVVLRADHVTVQDGGFIASNTLDNGDAGRVVIRADHVAARDGGSIASNTFGDGDAGRVVVSAADVTVRDGGFIASNTLDNGDAGRVVITAGDLTVQGIGSIQSVASGEGDAGTLVIRAHDLTMQGNGLISTGAEGEGDQGRVVVTAGNMTVQGSGSSISGGTVVVTAGDLTVRGLASGIMSDTKGQRDAGRVVVTADRLTIRDRGQISSDSDGEGTAGQVVVKADDLTVEGGFITSRAGVEGDGGTVMVTAGNLTVEGGFGGISSETTGEGDAGRVVVSADRLMMRGSGEISSDSFGGAEGDAGTVVVTAGRLTMRDGAKISSETDRHNAGDAGRVTVRAGVVDVRGGRITSAAFSAGDAGRVTVSAQRLLLDRGEISASSASAGGGAIQIAAEDLIDLRNSSVTTSVAGGDDPTAGNILIDPKVLVIDGSTIEADADTGNGGNIRIIADNILVPEGDLQGLIARGDMSASGETAVDSGTVAISAPEVDISGDLVALEAALLDPASQLRQRCGARRDIGASSLTGVGRGGLPPTPDGPLLSDYAPRQKLSAGSAVEIDARDRSKAAPGAVTLVLPCRGSG